MKYLCLSWLPFLFIFSCKGQNQRVSDTKVNELPPKTIFLATSNIYGPVPDPFLEGQISEYVRRIFQDRNGALWFGTNSDGVCRYDGKTLTYFTTTEGFSGHAVRGMVADDSGNIWFATSEGVCRYDISRADFPCNNNTCGHNLQTEAGVNAHSRELAKSFTKFTQLEGLGDDRTWSILKDKTGNIWVGTEGGVFCYQAEMQIFTPFQIPSLEPKDYPGNAYPAPKLVNSMMQDKAGNIWFGSNGTGVYRYDGTSLTNLSEKEGLCNNFVQCMLEDKSGVLWFGSRFGGLSRFDPVTRHFTNFSIKDGLTTDFIWTLLEDDTTPPGEVGIWISAVAGGLYRYDSGQGGVSEFKTTEGLTTKHVQSIFKDRNGKIWLGCSGGLFRMLPGHGGFVNVKRIGPWE